MLGLALGDYFRIFTAMHSKLVSSRRRTTFRWGE
jgi:hypothetical protein